MVGAIIRQAPPNKAHATDAASRPQDRADFETWLRLKRVPGLSPAARLMRNSLGGSERLLWGLYSRSDNHEDEYHHLERISGFFDTTWCPAMG
jgi:hypothetical protein